MALLVSSLGSTFNTNSGTKTVLGTPTVGELLVIIVAHTGSTTSNNPTDNNPDGLGNYTLITSAVKASSTDTMRVYVRNALIGNSSLTTFTHAPSGTTGGGLAVIRINGASKVGSAIVRSSGIQSNITSGAPSPTLSSTPLTGNAIIGAVFNATNPATLTPRTSYTEQVDTGYGTPATGFEVMSRDSGETSANIIWNNNSPSAFCSVAIELSAAVTHNGEYNQSGTGTVVAIGSAIVSPLATLNGAGTQSSTSYISTTGVADLQAIGSKASVGIKVVFGASEPTGIGSFSSSADKFLYGLTSFLGTGSLESFSFNTTLGLSNLTASGTFISDSIKYFAGFSNLTIENLLTANSTLIPFSSELYVKVDDIWRLVPAYVKHNGTWKEPDQIFKHIDNQWKRVY